ncbi:MAG: Bifunctional protein FolD [Candidatus Uhrbacteria bacterium GW2011_GWF2_41_16]|uniref:Bifunctional protein FolD n=2 Tax=Candidatus Uhriibacteriota TaxID=1752732 RepID=A0A0G0XL15_9BACT|nr:MAG: Bifunctional protein FolD [Candidatus Uhrbacteria bacterium GW2011_GWA2_41_10]KKR86662.1 MAG: Bifunctional protein FolD [Candidatus Uhrbacteria bacterium GW2011_GWC2_41_11]KKR97480.1 MAG: Bifunctional protein FolD [Candidatus Uhrbacteria bacterium GW2011_GWF2_41_16]HBP00149.1 bifunctional methylenetetrahydrofolate dehydrogenase/methenyltetrahydrofolate cyclohydrolase [Candidatus Uhrbacteria bacterium]
MTHIINGRKLAVKIRMQVKKRISSLAHIPGLAVLLVGDDPASHTYVRLKEKACKEAGIFFEKHLYPSNVKEENILSDIATLNERTDIHGILVQLPLPHQNTDRMIAAIDPQKDVDGFHPENIRRLDTDKPGIISPVALGIMKLITSTEKSFQGCSAVIIASPLFAHPIEVLLREYGIVSTIVSAQDPLLKEKTKTADILIVAVGKPNLITRDYIKSGAVVIDVGTTRVDNHIVGDVDRTSVESIAGWLTPVPGGVGPMTVALLLVSILKAYQLQK